jgi:transglutaminase-like putative cysteine protease
MRSTSGVFLWHAACGNKASRSELHPLEWPASHHVRLNMQNDLQPRHSLTVRIGCAFTYEATGMVPLVLNLKPRRDPWQALHEEKLVLGSNLPAEEFVDAHGNIVHRLILRPGRNDIRHDAIVAVPPHGDNHEFGAGPALSPADIPAEFLRYTLPSRYCDSDKFLAFAWQQFGALPPGRAQVQAICDWVHGHIEYRFGSGSPELSAWDVLQRGYGVCRDFAHLTVAMCRALNLPARYVTGHLPDIGYIDPGSPMDFHAYSEVYLAGRWFTYDARFNVPRIGRVKVSCGLDAVDGAFATVYGPAKLTYFEVWAYQVPAGEVTVSDPVDLSKRLDGTLEVRGLAV